jgi:hypothetical protein
LPSMSISLCPLEGMGPRENHGKDFRMCLSNSHKPDNGIQQKSFKGCRGRPDRLE